MNDKEKIDEFLNKLRNKIKISKRIGEAYLPLHMDFKEKKAKP